MCEQIGDAEVCITGWSNAQFTSKVLDCAENLKVIAHTGGTVAFLTNDEVYDRGIRVLSGNCIRSKKSYTGGNFFNLQDSVSSFG